MTPDCTWETLRPNAVMLLESRRNYSNKTRCPEEPWCSKINGPAAKKASLSGKTSLDCMAIDLSRGT